MQHAIRKMGIKKKGLSGEALTNILIWIVFLSLAGLAVTLLVRRFTG